jgi:hypothetical protein
MSDIGLKFTFIDLARGIAGWAFLYAAPPLLAAVLLLFAVPSWRRAAAVRRIALGLLGIVFILGLIGAPYLIYEANRTIGPLLRRQELAGSATMDGIGFPAGTKLQLDEHGHIQSGVLPSATLIENLLLTGPFKMEHGLYTRSRIWAGVLAHAADIEGVPCAAGPFEQPDEVSPQILKCRLAADFNFLDYPLAAGSLIELAPSRKPTRLQHGVLRSPLILFDIDWPAGTVIDAEDHDAAALRHPGKSARLCLPQYGVVIIAGIEVHGAAEVLTGSWTDIWSDPEVIAGHCPDAGRAGYLLQQGVRQTHVRVPL